MSEPWDRYLDDDMARLPDHVVVALEQGPVAPAAIGALSDGYAVTRDHGIEVAVRTLMPGVTPAMWDWWFGWHGSHDSRYRLWHPRAHVSAQWADGVNGAAADADPRRGRERYVGRTSHVVEYIGSTLARAAIRFVPPARAGDPAEETSICAVVGLPRGSLTVGRLVHDVRRTAGGSEMRSRFRLGGKQASVLLRPVLRLGELDGRALLVHCAQEMNHLAARLPGLYDEFGSA